MSDKKLKSTTNALFSNSVTGLTFDDFTNRAILLPAAAQIEKKENASINRNDSLENFSEISLDSSSVTDQPGQQGYYNPLGAGDYSSNAPPQLDLNQQSSVAGSVDASGNKFASDIQASFSQLPSVASTVFSTFSSIIKGASAPIVDPNHSSGHTQDLRQSAPTPKSTLDELYEQQYGGGGLQNPSFIGEDGNAFLAPAPNQVAPTFFSPDDPLLTAAIAPNFAITETGGNAFRLGTNKKKIYAHAPGLSGNQQPPQAIKRVDNFPIPPIPQTSNADPISGPVVPQVEAYQQPQVSAYQQPPPVVSDAGQSRFSLTSFFPSQILEKIPKAASTFYQQSTKQFETSTPVVAYEELSGFGIGVAEEPVGNFQPPQAAPSFDPRNFNTRPIGEAQQQKIVSPLQQPPPAAVSSYQAEPETSLPPPPTFFAPSHIPAVPKSSANPANTNPYSSARRGIVTYKNNSLIPLSNTGPILIPNAGEPVAQPISGNFFNPVNSQAVEAQSPVYFQPPTTQIPENKPALDFPPPLFAPQVESQPEPKTEFAPFYPPATVEPQVQTVFKTTSPQQEPSPELSAFYQPTTSDLSIQQSPPPIAPSLFNPISADVTDVNKVSDSFQPANAQQGDRSSFQTFNYFQKQTSLEFPSLGIPKTAASRNNSLIDESLVVHASNTSLDTSFCSEIQNIFDKDRQQQGGSLNETNEFENFDNNYANTATPSPPPFPTDTMETTTPIAQSPTLDCPDALPKSTNIAYRPVYKHWFYKLVEDTKTQWLPFSMSDSLALEEASQQENQQLIATDGGRFDVSIADRLRTPIYWSRPPNEVRRCSWFFKSVDSRFVPYEENIADLLEDEYKTSSQTGNWHRKISVNNGETVVFHGPSVMVHFLQSQNPDSWNSTPVAGGNRPRVVKRGCDEFNIDDGEPERVDHLLFMVHGIGAACDLKFRTVEEVVDEFRSIAQQLVQSHYRSAFDQGDIGRVEVLPVSWHNELHSEESGIDEKLKNITLESIPKMRAFTNDSILDVLFYTSPVFCQSIIDTVGNSINRSYTTFCKRNPSFNGGVSLAGHSLGSLILFDLLCHQTATNREGENEKENMENPDSVASPVATRHNKHHPLRRSVSQQINYTFGSAGTVGQPFIVYPQLLFHVTKFFAMGSPIGMFVTIRGIDKLGLNFHLPTCDGFFNIFHPYDPVAYRCEPLINADLAELRPVLIKHHKGRKRMHLELKETIGRVGNDLKQKIFYTFRNALDIVYSITTPNKTDQQAIEKEVDKVLEKQLNLENPNKCLDKDEQRRRDRTNSCSTQSLASDIDSGETDMPLGLLNNYRRIDYVLQEAPLEFFNEYLFALTSHVCYWESEDTTLFVIKEIYASMGVRTDNQIPQQSMTIERPISEVLFVDEDEQDLMGAVSSHSSKR